MAKVTKKDAKRHRMQITVSAIRHAEFVACKELADKLGAKFDFGDDFDWWFCDQLKQIRIKLEVLQDVQTEATLRQLLVPADAAVAPKPAIFTPAATLQESVAVQSQGAAMTGTPAQLATLTPEPVSVPAKKQTAILVENIAKTALPTENLPLDVTTVVPVAPTIANKTEKASTVPSAATPGTSEPTVTTTPAQALAPKSAPVQPGTQAQETAQSQAAAAAGIPAQPTPLPQKPVSAPVKEQTAIPVEDVAKTASPTKDLPLDMTTVAPEVSVTTNKTEPASTAPSPATSGMSEPTVTIISTPAPAPKPAQTDTLLIL